MKNIIITVLISTILSVTIASLLGNNLRFGASGILTTNSSDTIETFRTNVNTSLTNLIASSTNGTMLSASIGSTATTTITSAGKIGIASSTPTSQLSIGTTGATSTISTGRFCAYVKDEAGRGMYLKLSITGNTVFSTSTTPCNQ